jgi:hypothetical protein
LLLLTQRGGASAVVAVVLGGPAGGELGQASESGASLPYLVI